MKTFLCRALLLMGLLQFAVPSAQAGERMSAEIIAVQIRIQGYDCDRPLSAERDKKMSKPHAVAWILKCENATYRVRLIPKMAAKAERLD